MKKLFLTAILLLAFKSAAAQTSGFGVGVILGEPTGISMKKYVSRTVAVDGGLAWSFISSDAFHIHADILYHTFDVFDAGPGHWALHYGPGARLAFGKHTRIGARFPVGISFTMDEQIFEAFFELAPTLDLLPATDFTLNAAIGVRFYFW